jgi:hypothetical protein
MIRVENNCDGQEAKEKSVASLPGDFILIAPT